MKLSAFSQKAAAGLVAAMTVILCLSACERLGNGINARREIAVSVLSTDEAKTQALWAPVLADMQKQSGLQVRIVPAANYEAQIIAFQTHKAQIGWFPNLTGAEVVIRDHGEVFAEADGLSPYQSLIVTQLQSKLTAEDLLKCNRRLTIGLGEVRDAAAGQAPLYYLFQPKSVELNSCFKAVRRGAAADNVADVVANKLDVAAADSDTLDELKRTAPKTFAKLKVIWASEPLPEDVLIYRQDLDPVTREKLRSFFLSYGRAPGTEGDRQRAILRALALKGFIPEDNDHFISIRLMKASVDLMRAEAREDKGVIARAKQILEKVRAEKRAADAKTAPQAPADAQAVSSG
jgi:phosphonate transport system substrate-binding protein